ncbi:MAG: NAD+ synthase [Alphaproteobacteria bacterium]|nr:NAD+ synthase [Alphaproteobacteria bacterium]
MTDNLKIFLAQRNPTVGDITGNVALIRDSRAAAAAAGADLVVFPELIVCGYPPEDLVLKPFFQDRVEAAVYELAKDTADGGPAMLVSAPWRYEDGLYSAVMLLDDGEIAATRLKYDLPNYSVFDEKRVFKSGPLPGPMSFRDVRLGVMICEDMWQPDVAECLEESGAEILIVVNGSPFESDKADLRMQLATRRVTESGLPLVYVNQVGGQDELVFDGASFVLNADRAVAGWMPAFREAGQMTEWAREGDGWVCARGERILPPEDEEAMYRAMVLGLSDYVRKNGFPGVIIGLSGGIDSALTAAVAVDALGPDKVYCVMMPSPYTSAESLEDAAGCAAALGVKLDEVGIAPAMKAFDEMLKPVFGDRAPDTTEENIQARSRGIILMALSNKLGHMLLTTGNKSEMSVGYATLYGDMAGGYSVLKDVYKTDVFALSRWRNANRPGDFAGPGGEVIPDRIITKPPSAELRPDQTDQDSLPPYDVLDDILRCLIEGEMGVDEITARGHKPELVQRVWRMLDIAEYKRRQAPPGVKISSRAFGRDRRYPITNSFTKIL